MFVSDVRVVWALILKGVGITAGECITMWIDRVSHGPYFSVCFKTVLILLLKCSNTQIALFQGFRDISLVPGWY